MLSTKTFIPTLLLLSAPAFACEYTGDWTAYSRCVLSTPLPSPSAGGYRSRDSLGPSWAELNDRARMNELLGEQERTNRLLEEQNRLIREAQEREKARLDAEDTARRIREVQERARRMWEDSIPKCGELGTPLGSECK